MLEIDIIILNTNESTPKLRTTSFQLSDFGENKSVYPPEIKKMVADPEKTLKKLVILLQNKNHFNSITFLDQDSEQETNTEYDQIKTNDILFHYHKVLRVIYDHKEYFTHQPLIIPHPVRAGLLGEEEEEEEEKYLLLYLQKDLTTYLTTVLKKDNSTKTNFNMFDLIPENYSKKPEEPKDLCGLLALYILYLYDIKQHEKNLILNRLVTKDDFVWSDEKKIKTFHSYNGNQSYIGHQFENLEFARHNGKQEFFLFDIKDAAEYNLSDQNGNYCLFSDLQNICDLLNIQRSDLLNIFDLTEGDEEDNTDSLPDVRNKKKIVGARSKGGKRTKHRSHKSSLRRKGKPHRTKKKKSSKRKTI
jgi:hypothetical protein